MHKEFDINQLQAMSRALCGEDTHMEIEKAIRLRKMDDSARLRLLLVRLKKQSDLETCAGRGSS